MPAPPPGNERFQAGLMERTTACFVDRFSCAGNVLKEMRITITQSHAQNEKANNACQNLEGVVQVYSGVI